MASKAHSVVKIIYFGLLATLVAWFLFNAIIANAIFVSSPQDPLLPGDVGTTEILDASILDIDISSSTRIQQNKIATSTWNDFVSSTTQTFQGTKTFASSTIFQEGISSSSQPINTNRIGISNDAFFVTNLAQTFAGVKTFSSLPATTAGDCVADNDFCRKSFVDGAGPATIQLTAAENLTIGDPLSMASSTWERQQFAYILDGVASSFGDATLSAREIGCGINPDGAVSLGGVAIKLSITGTPGDSVNVALYGDSAGNPDGATLRSASTTAVNLDGTARYYSFYWPNIDLATSTQYHIVLDRSGADSDAAYYSAYPGATVDARGNYQTRTVGWNAAITDDCAMRMLTRITAGEVYRSDTSFATSTEGFVGFAAASAATGTSLNVRLLGNLTGLSGLTIGKYYLGTASGTITREPAAVRREVGFAYSSTAFIVRP